MLEEHKDYIVVIPTNKEEDDLIQSIRKYKMQLNVMNANSETYKSKRAMYSRLDNTDKRGRAGFYELHNEIINRCNITDDASKHILKFLAYPLQADWMYQETDFFVIDRRKFTNHGTYYRTNDDGCIYIGGIRFMTWIGRMSKDEESWYGEQPPLSDYFTEYYKSKHNLIPEPIPQEQIDQSDTIIEMMDNLELNQNDYIKLLKYITQKI
jgi:hypothetical protein